MGWAWRRAAAPSSACPALRYTPTTLGFRSRRVAKLLYFIVLDFWAARRNTERACVSNAAAGAEAERASKVQKKQKTAHTKTNLYTPSSAVSRREPYPWTLLLVADHSSLTFTDSPGF